MAERLTDGRTQFNAATDRIGIRQTNYKSSTRHLVDRTHPTISLVQQATLLPTVAVISVNIAATR